MDLFMKLGVLWNSNALARTFGMGLYVLDPL
jgi:hypothetical protein